MLIFYVVILGLLYIFTPFLNLKKDRFLPILFCGLLIILMGGQTKNPDYLIYRTIFNGEFYSKDPGFGLIMKLLKFLGFTDSNFRLGIALIGFALISITVFKYLKDRRLFYLFYAVYPFMFDVVQARNFLVMSIITLFIPTLIKPDLKKRIMFIIAVLVAYTIQKVAILYLPLVVIDVIVEKKCSKYFFRTISLVFVIVSLNKSTLLKFVNAFILPLTRFFKELSSYVGVNTSYGWIIFWLEQICIYLLIVYANRLIARDYKKMCFIDNTNEYYEKLQLSELMVKVNYYMFVFLPLFILNENYTRIIRNLLPLNIIVFVIALTKNRNKIIIDKKRLLLLIGVMAYLLVLFYLLFNTYAPSIVYPTIYENWIL